MFVIYRKKLSLAISCMFMVGFAYASSDNTQDGFWYLDVGAGVSKINNLPNPALSIGVSAGYSFNDYVAVEALWNGQPSFQWNNYLLNNYNIYDLAVKGSIPFTNYFSMYGKLGYGADYSSWSGTASTSAPSIYNHDSSAWGTNALFTVGINFSVSRELGIYLENNNYVPVTKGSGSFDYANATMLGLSYSFGRGSSVMPDTSATNSDPIYGVITSYHDALKQQQITNEQSTQSYDPAIVSSCDADCITVSQRLIRQADGSSYIIVMSGDTLKKYERTFGVSVSRIQKLNNLDNNKIVIGQKVFINSNRN